jgi:hybrid cluster-associated redox disulfide protein
MVADNNFQVSQTQKKLVVTKDWTIGDIFKNFPSISEKLADSMTEYGLGCVGCHANQYETLEQGVLGHGFDEEILQSVIEDLNKIISESEEGESSDGGIKISSNAITKLSEVLSRKSKEAGKEVMLRISYNDSGEGCCKELYSLSFEAKPTENDIMMDIAQGVRIVLKKEHSNNFNNIELDYVETDSHKGFKITALMDDGGCCGGGGCGDGGSCSH